MKKTFLIVLALLFSLTACSDYYTEEYVESIRDSYKDEISMLEDRIAGLESALLSSYDEGYSAGLVEGYNEGYDDGHSGAYDEGYDDGHAVGYESGYDDGHAVGCDSGYDEGYDDAREDATWDTISDYPEWLLDSEITEFWGELYNALTAFWSGDTSDLSAFEDGLYDVILDIYGEYKADTPKGPDPPEPPEDPPPPTYTVYITEFGEKYHSYGCQYLKNSCYAIDKNAAIAKGYTACSRCKP